MAQFFVTALRRSPQKHEDSAVPRVVSMDTTKIVSVTVLNESNGAEHLLIKERTDRYTRSTKAAEKLGQYLLQTDFNNAASSPFNNGVKVNAAACGSTAQGASATPLSTAGLYFATVTAATATSMILVKLPNASTAGRIGTALVVQNSASTAITVIPAASESLDSGTAGSTSIAAGQFKHFYCSTTAKWTTCKGPYY